MANSQLKGKSYKIEPEFIKFLGTNISYDALKMKISRLKNAQENSNHNEFDRLGGTKTLSYADKLLNDDRNAVTNEKAVCSDSGVENCFIRTHEKDRDNANPTGIGGNPLMHKGSINKKIMTGKEVYNESLNKEINSIRYLIEYMTNNKKQIK